MTCLSNYSYIRWMKKTISLLILIITSCTFSFSQSVNGVPLEDIDAEYIRIVGTARLLSGKVIINLEFGQQDKLFSGKDLAIVDSTGKSVVFNSMIDALNYMASFGYEFQAAYAITVGQQNVYHYLMRRKRTLHPK